MPLYYFDDDKAQRVCARHVVEGAPILTSERQRDVDGFWQVLLSAAGQEKLRVKESTRAPEPVLHPPPLVPPGEEDQRDA